MTLQRWIERVEVGRQRRQCAAKIVGHRQRVLGEAFDAELAFALDVLLGASAHVLRLGGGTQVLVLQFGVLGLEAFDDALQHFEGRFGAFDRRLSRGVARGWIAGHWLSLVAVVSLGGLHLGMAALRVNRPRASTTRRICHTAARGACNLVPRTMMPPRSPIVTLP